MERRKNLLGPVPRPSRLSLDIPEKDYQILNAQILHVTFRSLFCFFGYGCLNSSSVFGCLC